MCKVDGSAADTQRSLDETRSCWLDLRKRAGVLTTSDLGWTWESVRCVINPPRISYSMAVQGQSRRYDKSLSLLYDRNEQHCGDITCGDIRLERGLIDMHDPCGW